MADPNQFDPHERALARLRGAEAAGGLLYYMGSGAELKQAHTAVNVPQRQQGAAPNHQ